MRCVSPSVGNHRASDRKCSENGHSGPAPATSLLRRPTKRQLRPRHAPVKIKIIGFAAWWLPSPERARQRGEDDGEQSGGRTRAQITGKMRAVQRSRRQGAPRARGACSPPPLCRRRSDLPDRRARRQHDGGGSRRGADFAARGRGKEIILADLRAGEMFGEIALLDGKPRSANATAHTNCELMVWSAATCCRSSNATRRPA